MAFLLLKIFYSLFVCVLVPAYWTRYGPSNFLWFSDLALLLGLAALWLESPLLASTQALSVVVFELIWIADFLVRAVSGKSPIGIAAYMFDPAEPRFFRGLSLFHVPLPFVLLGAVYRWGYDARALIAQTLLFWLVMIVCYFFTSPSKNINWAFGPGNPPRKLMPAPLYLVFLLIGVPLLVYLPTHLLLEAVAPPAGSF
ncbi:MAG TPA: membrane-associated protein [candidate division Zixibacteria bacterium]|nr:membrane-associated protein [candidate division Zixibacteria bacterium]